MDLDRCIGVGGRKLSVQPLQAFGLRIQDNFCTDLQSHMVRLHPFIRVPWLIHIFDIRDVAWTLPWSLHHVVWVCTYININVCRYASVFIELLQNMNNICYTGIQIYIYMHIHIYAYTYVYIQVYKYIHMYISVCIGIHTYIYMHVWINIHVYICVYIYIYIHIYTYIYMYKYMYIYMYLHNYMHV